MTLTAVIRTAPSTLRASSLLALMWLLMVERYGLGFDYFATYRKAIESVTAADVQTVAKKYLDPEKMILVAAGPIDEKGQPSKKEK